MKRLIRCFVIVSAALLASAQVILAHGFIVVPHAHPDAPATSGHFSFAPLTVKQVIVQTTIHNLRAETTVEQVFFNPRNVRLEGTWIFPLPADARIDTFEMDIDGVMTEAELLPAAKARGIYEKIVREMRDPALLEYDGREALKLRIFPIQPRSEKRIRLRYTQLLKDDSGIIEHTCSPGTEKFSATPIEKIALSVEIRSDLPIKTVYSPTQGTTVKRLSDKHAQVHYQVENARPDSPFQLVITRDPQPLGIHLFTHRGDADQDGTFMILASPGQAPATTVQPKDICFVLDTSGSMAGGKLDQAKQALLFCLDNLNPSDRFEVIPFASQAEPTFGQLVPADKTHLAKASNALKALKPIGGTAIADALEVALNTSQNHKDIGENKRPRMVIFLTDGLPTVGERREQPLLDLVNQHNSAGLRIFSFGIGDDVNTHFLDRIAEQTRAFSHYVTANEDLELKLSRFYSKIKDPVLTDLTMKINAPGVQLSKLEPSRLPDLFDGDMLVVFGRYSGHGPGEIHISGEFNGARHSFKSKVRFAESSPHHEYIPAQWATRRIGSLLDLIRQHGESDELIDEITQLARQHGVVTPYTAYLIIEDERKRNVPAARRNLREMEADPQALDQARKRMDSLRQEAIDATARTGSTATDNANSLQWLQGRVGASPAQADLAKSPSPMPATEHQGYRASRALHYATQTRTLKGRTFYQNSGIWQDSTAQAHKDITSVQIAFNSPAWFALLRKHPDSYAWLSLGTDVDVLIENVLYQIRG